MSVAPLERRLQVGDMLLNRRCGERIVVVAADDDSVWLREVGDGDELRVIDGNVWLKVGKSERHRCSQHYAQIVFEMEGE